MLRTALASLLLVPAFAVAQEVEIEEATAQVAAKVVASKAWYPSEKCLVQDRRLKEGKAVTVAHEGRIAKVCCKRCAKAVKADPDRYFAKLDQQIVSAQMDSYPLSTCAVSGEKLGSMGKPKDIVVAGRLVRLCCKGCVKKATKNAAATIAKIETALCAEKGDAAATCPVSGKPVKKGKGVNLVYGTDVVRLCCPGCIKKFDKEPAKYLAKTDHEGHGKGHDRGHGEHDKGKP